MNDKSIEPTSELTSQSSRARGQARQPGAALSQAPGLQRAPVWQRAGRLALAVAGAGLLAMGSVQAQVAGSASASNGDAAGRQAPERRTGPDGRGDHGTHGHGRGPHRGHGHHFMEHGPGGPGLERRVDRLVQQAGGTPEQATRIKALYRAGEEASRADHEKRAELMRQRMELLKAPFIDRNALEGVRAREVELFDAASRRRMKTLADAAEVLTPEQRANLARSREQGRHERRSRDAAGSQAPQ